MQTNQNQENSNGFSLESLELDFNKNKKHKQKIQTSSSTDRINKIIVDHTDSLKTDRSALIQKKKNYSDIIRQRNQNIMKKKKVDSLCNQTTSQIKEQNSLIDIKQNILTEVPIAKIQSNLLKKQQKSKSVYNLQKKRSISNISALNLDPIPLIQSVQYESIINKKLKQQLPFKIDEPAKTVKTTKKYQICSNLVSQTIYVYDADVNILQKQNTTFKRDLANFKKENSQLRKQLSEAKKQIQEMETKAKDILESSLIKNFVECQQSQALSYEEKTDNSTEIIQKLREEIIQLQKVKSGLQLKAYMAEKRVIQQVNMHKKRMAKQLGEWRQKCTKLRAENMKFKCIRDMTISMNISKDQQ